MQVSQPIPAEAPVTTATLPRHFASPGHYPMWPAVILCSISSYRVFCSANNTYAIWISTYNRVISLSYSAFRCSSCSSYAAVATLEFYPDAYLSNCATFARLFSPYGPRNSSELLRFRVA